MFSEGSLIWALGIMLKPLFLLAGVILIFVVCIYIFSRHLQGRFSIDSNNEKQKAFLLAIVVSQVIALLFATVYITHHLGWTLFPDFWVGMAFANTQYHFAILSTAPAIGILSSIALLRFKQSVPWPDLGISRPKLNNLQVAGLTIGGLLIVVSCSLLWTHLTGLRPEGGKLIVETINALGGQGIYYAVFVVMLSPILDEIFFRGILFSALKDSIGLYAGLLAQAFICAAAHLSMADFVPLFLHGLVLGYVYHKSGSLFPSMLIHSLLNALVVLGIQYGF